ncbi:MAG: hypothetical protein GY938_09720 [Ketobacter sp.]|nr:hypothetical protein [Ketobacter sp.]
MAIPKAPQTSSLFAESRSETRHYDLSADMVPLIIASKPEQRFRPPFHNEHITVFLDQR